MSGNLKIGVCLISADRYEYTLETVESFVTHNDLSRFHALIQADDASEDDRVLRLGEIAKFRNITSHKRRKGGQEMRRLAFKAAAEADCTHALILENDERSVRPFPWDLARFAFSNPSVYCLRLYGIYKEEGRRKCVTTHRGKNNADSNWTLIEGAPEPAEIGDIHWGAQPCVTRMKELLWLHDGTRSEGQIRRKTGELDFYTVRTVNNVFYHIGEDRTPGFKQ